VANGVTRFGQSELFTVPLNGSITLQPIIFGTITPIPSSLTLTATPPSLTTLGATSQIKAVATYSDGHTTDVSAASSGTNYTSSNTAVATVSAEGVVSAVSNGTVLITAFNEGTSGSGLVTVGIPPQITITSPVDGATVTEGATIPITAQVTGGATVASVSFSVNGRIQFTTVSAPFIFNFTVPTGVSVFTLGASVRDIAGSTATAPNIVILAIPDPLTTVIGTVVDPTGTPTGGASVNCVGVTGTTSITGSFSIPGVPTARGSIVCFASIFIVSGIQLSGSSAAAPPVLGGTTNVGQIALSALSSRGTDFWMAFQNYPFGSGAQLFILTETSADFTVSSLGFNVTGTVTAQAPATVAIPNSLQITSSQAIENKGIHLTSSAEITATFFYPQAFTNDTYLAIPTALLGTEYLAATYVGGPAEFVVVGTQSATTVTLTPACSSFSGTPAGSTVTISLNQGQTYQYLCSGDATGSQITSDKPVGVIAGNGCVNIGNSACDILSEMMFPVASLYGTDLYSAPFPGNSLDLIRIVAARDNTTITVDDGVSPTTYHLNRGKFQELRTKRPSHYISDKPISVVQFFADSVLAGNGTTLGDPLSMQILPTNAFRNTARFYSPSGFAQGNFAIIIAPTSAISSVALNGVPVSGFAPLPGGTYQYVVTPVVTAQSVVTASQPVAVYTIGLTPFGSYGAPTAF